MNLLSLVCLSLREKCVTKPPPPIMTDRKPYLLRAIHDWITDNEMTPHIVIKANVYGVQVPQDFVQNDQITLSTAIRSVHELVIDEEGVRFGATFGGTYHQIHATLPSILAIFARESGQGMVFSEPDLQPDPGFSAESEQVSKPLSRPGLRVVK